jgi:hypothetical protein
VPSTNPSLRRLSAQHAARRRWVKNNPDATCATDADDVAAELAERRIAEYITKITADAPPLSEVRLARLAGLLRQGRPSVALVSAEPPAPVPAEPTPVEQPAAAQLTTVILTADEAARLRALLGATDTGRPA